MRMIFTPQTIIKIADDTPVPALENTTQVASKLAKPQTIPSGLISLGYELLARGDSRRFKTFGTWQKNGVRIALSGNTLSAERGGVVVYQADDGEMTLEALITDPELRGQGRASAALRDLTSIADEVGAKLFLEPVQLEASGLDRNSLKKLYTSAGFKSADNQSMVMTYGHQQCWKFSPL